MDAFTFLITLIQEYNLIPIFIILDILVLPLSYLAFKFKGWSNLKFYEKIMLSISYSIERFESAILLISIAIAIVLILETFGIITYDNSISLYWLIAGLFSGYTTGFWIINLKREFEKIGL